LSKLVTLVAGSTEKWDPGFELPQGPDPTVKMNNGIEKKKTRGKKIIWNRH
jgi:hypothetical protein